MQIVKREAFATKEHLYRDYVSAEVTLVWTVSAEEQKNRLIFAVTELIPEDQLASKPLGIPSTSHLKNHSQALQDRGVLPPFLLRGGNGA